MPIYVRSKRHTPPRAAAATPPPPPAPQKKGELLFGLPQPPAGWPQKPAGLSVCMIVKNEERFLAQALRSVQDVADEIVVVDTGSTDRTVEIAKSFGATVVEREWRNDFAWARNQALELATKRWILSLDADEEIVAESKPALLQLKTAPAYRTAVWVRIYNRSDDYIGTGDMSHALVRIFPNDPAIRYRGLIHEFPTIDDSPNGLQGATSPISIVHYGYVKEVVHERNKGARNLAIVRAAAEADPTDAYNWFNVGSTAFLIGDYEQAREALEKMVELVGDEHRGFVPNGLTVLAETYCDKLGDPAKGEACARRCLELSPNYANAHFQLGKALIAQRRYDEAREAYKEAIADGKYAAMQFVVDDQVYVWKAFSEIGSSFVMEGDDRSAIEWFEKGLKNAPKAEPLHVNRARALERLGRLEEADAGYRAVYEMHHSPSSTIEWVNALLRRGRQGEAVDIIEQQYESLTPETAVPMLMAAAAIEQRKGSLDDERYLQLAARIAPGSADVLNPLEALLRARGRESEIPTLVFREEGVAPKAEGDFLRRAQRAANDGRFSDGRDLALGGLQAFPESNRLRYALGFSLAQLGDPAAALTVLGAIETDERELAVATYMLRAKIHRSQKSFGEMGFALARVLEIDPGHVDALLLQAALMEETGDAAGQEEALKRAFEIDPPRIAVQLSGFYLAHGRFQEAASVADRALSTS